MGGLRLSHCGVDRVHRAPARRLALPRVHQFKRRPKSQGIGQSDIRLERPNTAGLDVVNGGQADAGNLSHLPEGHPAAKTLLTYRRPEDHGDPAHLSIRPAIASHHRLLPP